MPFQDYANIENFQRDVVSRTKIEESPICKVILEWYYVEILKHLEGCHISRDTEKS